MQVVEEITTSDSIKELTKEILKSKITKNQIDDYLNYVENKRLKQYKYAKEKQNEQEISH